jgi:hemerythrin-like domain-containing protein
MTERGTTTTERSDAIAMLLDDHRELRKLFGEFARADRGDRAACRGIVELACAELAFHTALEEEIFYPAARGHLGDDQRLIDEAEVDHAAAKALIALLAAFAPDDPSYVGTFLRLTERVNDHIANEEREIFPRLASAAFDAAGVTVNMRRRKEELLGAVATPAQAEPSLEAEGRGEPTAGEALRQAERA